MVRVSDQGIGRQQKVFAVDCALGTICHRLRHVHVLIVERATSPGAVPVARSLGSLCSQARGCVSRHGRLLVLSCSLVGEVCPLGCSSVQLVERLVKRLLEPEMVLPHSVDCSHSVLSGTSQQVVNRESGLRMGRPRPGHAWEDGPATWSPLRTEGTHQTEQSWALDWTWP